MTNIDEYIKTNFILWIISEGQLPKGAIYIGEKSSVNGGMKTTDRYYEVPVKEASPEPPQVVEKRPKKYEGIGPLDEKGMPLAFRMVKQFMQFPLIS